MSYILDALKKSEQARGGRKTRRMFEEFPESLPPPSRTSGSSRRWLYLFAFILFLNMSFFAFWAAPWRRTAPPPKAGRAARPGKPAVATSPPGAPTAPKPFVQVSRTTAPKPKASGSPVGGPTAPKPKDSDSLAAAPSPPTARALKQSPLRASRARKSPGPGLAIPVGGPTAPATAARHSRRNALELKAAALKALLEKQAERAKKAAKPASRRQRFSDVRSFATPKPASEHRVQRFNQLPSQIRESLPNMSVSMLDYSKRPAGRFIIINGTKRHEGDEVSPGLRLERITPDGAIFAYMGKRFYMSVLGD